MFARGLSYLLAVALVVFGLWPYVTLWRIDQALAKPEAAAATALAPHVDLTSIQANYQHRFGTAWNSLLPREAEREAPMLGWLAETVGRLGEGAVARAVTIELVRELLRRASEPRASLIEAIDFAFFESWDRFVVRFGALEANPSFMILRLDGHRWRIVDLLPPR